MYILDQWFNSSAADPFKYFVNNDNRVTFTLQTGVDRIIQFGSFTIQTDYSYWPVTNSTTVYGAFADRAIDQNF